MKQQPLRKLSSNKIIRFIFQVLIYSFFLIPYSHNLKAFAEPTSPFESNPMPCPSAYLRSASPTSEVVMIPLFAPKKDESKRAHFWLIPVPAGAEFKIIADESPVFIDSLLEIKNFAASWFHNIKYSNDIYFACRLFTQGNVLPFYRQLYFIRSKKLPENYFDKIFKYDKINGGWPEIKAHAKGFGGIDERYKPVVDYYLASGCRFVFLYIADHDEFDRKAAYNSCNAVRFTYRGRDYKTNLHAFISYPSTPGKLFYPFKMFHECMNGDYPLMLTVLDNVGLVINEKLEGRVDLKYVADYALEQRLKNESRFGYSYLYGDFYSYNYEGYKVYSRIAIDSAGLNIADDSVLSLDLKNADIKSKEIRNFIDNSPINFYTMVFILIMTFVAAAFGFFGGKYYIGRNWKWFMIVTAGQWFVYAASNYKFYGDVHNWFSFFLFILLGVVRLMINNVFWLFLLLASPSGAISKKLKFRSSIAGYCDVFFTAVFIVCYLLFGEHTFTLALVSDYGRIIAFAGALVFLMNVKKFYPINQDEVPVKYKLKAVSRFLFILGMFLIAYIVYNTDGIFSASILLIVLYILFFMLHMLFEYLDMETFFVSTYWVKGMTLSLITILAFGCFPAFIVYSINDYIVELPLVERMDDIKALSFYGASKIPNAVHIKNVEPDVDLKNIMLDRLFYDYQSEVGKIISPYLQAALCAIIIFMLFKYDRKIFVYYAVYCISFFILLFYANMYVNGFLQEKFYKSSIIVKHGGTLK